MEQNVPRRVRSRVEVEPIEKLDQLLEGSILDHHGASIVTSLRYSLPSVGQCSKDKTVTRFTRERQSFADGTLIRTLSRL